MPPTWREQYDRMLRWRTRLSEPIKAEEGRDAYNERMADYLHAFFVTCDHVRDWLDEDTSAGTGPNQAKTYAKSATWLSRCNGISRGSKHAVITYGPLRGTSPSVAAGTTTKSELLDGIASRHSTKTSPDSYFSIEVGGNTHDALPAADACIDEWNVFLRGKGLI